MTADASSNNTKFKQPIDYNSADNDSKVNDSKVNDSKVNDSKVNDSKVNDSKVNDSKVNDNPKSQERVSAPQSLAALLNHIFESAHFPDPNTVVTGALDENKVAHAAAAGIEHIINLQPEAELSFDEAASVKKQGMHYTHIPIADAKDLKQLNLLEFDKALRAYQGKKTLIHCKSGNRVGACMALRAGWLRGRKMETALQTGKKHGLTGLEDEVRNRLLVPR